jgi:hypothetical protein
MANNVEKKLTFFQVLLSVAASMFGVQSHNNYKRDFNTSSFVPFMLVGIMFVVALVLLILAFVNFVLM